MGAKILSSTAGAIIWSSVTFRSIYHGGRTRDGRRRRATDRLFVARDDGVVGFVTFGVEENSYGTDVVKGVVENLYVRPDYRNRGLGSDLLSTAERHLRDRGADVVSLQTMADNEAARRFYRRHGYGPHRVELEKPAESDNHSKEGG
ncbi:GNAT family N-acetyltransferase [Halobacteriales archaeon QH_10_67_22]|nr:MAG: GNAT family N-acetyltransferase [Halobacteriales archaeon QH_10_67_22]